MSKIINLATAASLFLPTVGTIGAATQAKADGPVCVAGTHVACAPDAPIHKQHKRYPHVAFRQAACVVLLNKDGTPMTAADKAMLDATRAVKNNGVAPSEDIVQSWTTDGTDKVFNVSVTVEDEQDGRGCARFKEVATARSEDLPAGESYIKVGERIFVAVGTVLLGVGSAEYGSAALAGNLASKITVQGSTASANAAGGAGGSASSSSSSAAAAAAAASNQNNINNVNNNKLNQSQGQGQNQNQNQNQNENQGLGLTIAPTTPIGKNNGSGNAYLGM